MLSIANEVAMDIEEIYALEATTTFNKNIMELEVREDINNRISYYYESTKKVPFKFFGKTHMVDIYCKSIFAVDDQMVTMANKWLTGLFRNSEKISRDPLLVKYMIESADDYQTRVGRPSVKSFDDVTGVRITGIVFDDWRSHGEGNITSGLIGVWDAEPEHGLGILINMNLKCEGVTTQDALL